MSLELLTGKSVVVPVASFRMAQCVAAHIKYMHGVPDARANLFAPYAARVPAEMAKVVYRYLADELIAKGDRVMFLPSGESWPVGRTLLRSERCGMTEHRIEREVTTHLQRAGKLEIRAAPSVGFWATTSERGKASWYGQPPKRWDASKATLLCVATTSESERDVS